MIQRILMTKIALDSWATATTVGLVVMARLDSSSGLHGGLLVLALMFCPSRWLRLSSQYIEVPSQY